MALWGSAQVLMVLTSSSMVMARRANIFLHRRGTASAHKKVEHSRDIQTRPLPRPCSYGPRLDMLRRGRTDSAPASPWPAEAPVKPRGVQLVLVPRPAASADAPCPLLPCLWPRSRRLGSAQTGGRAGPGQHRAELGPELARVWHAAGAPVPVLRPQRIRRCSHRQPATADTADTAAATVTPSRLPRHGNLVNVEGLRDVRLKTAGFLYFGPSWPLK